MPSHSACLLLLLLPTGALADVDPADIFNDHVVLQRGVRVPVWGRAGVDEEITVEFAGQRQRTRAGKDGTWQVHLAPLRAAAEGSALIVSGANEVRFEDVLVGEVWYSSGQSNMGYTVNNMAKGLGEVGEAILVESNQRGIRFARVNERDRAEPQTRLSGRVDWKVCNPDTVKGFSAVAYVVASDVHRLLNDDQNAPKVPVGIIDASWGGKPIEAFVPEDQFVGHPVLEGIRDLANAGDLAGLKAMTGGTFARDASWLPGAIYNSRTAPIAPFAIRGFLWYQGESNAGVDEDPRHYSDKMRALVHGWRNAWGNPKLPFYFVQLPGFQPQATGWANLREEQRRSLDIAFTGMVVTIDIDSPGIHPPNKVDVGRRLARWALARDYGQPEAYSGPLYERIEIGGAKVTIDFEHADAGLMAGDKDGLAAVREVDGPLAGFELAAQDGVWHPAEVKIVGKSVVARSEKVSEPVAARYACSAVPEAPYLYNAAGLPASPFCSKTEFMVWKSSTK